jgi:hypothetical protein
MSDTDPRNAAKTPRKKATRREMAKRDAHIMERLVAGVTIEEIANNLGISVRLARERMSATLAQRAHDNPGEYVQMQIRRLNEAMIVAYGAMTGGNLKAVAQYLKILRELDRYHGFALKPPQEPQPVPALAPPPLALAPPQADEQAVGNLLSG